MARLRPPLELISIRTQPFEVVFIFIAVLSGLQILLAPTPGGSLKQLVGDFSWLWGGGILLGSAICIVSIFLTSPDTLLWERVGLFVLFTWFASYAFASFFITHSLVFVASYYSLTLAIASMYRVYQITKYVNLMKKAVEAN